MRIWEQDFETWIVLIKVIFSLILQNNTKKPNTEKFLFYFQDQILQQDIYMYL